MLDSPGGSSARRKSMAIGDQMTLTEHQPLQRVGLSSACADGVDLHGRFACAHR